MPKVTVLMPVYNAEFYIKEAVDSILKQTFDDFEFLIFNDGSTDSSADIVRSYNDQRITFFDSKQNKGYVHYLNYGIEIAKGEYIARMDADDISHPMRLKKQVDFMDRNPEIGVCGTWFRIIGSNYTVKHPTDDTKIRLSLLKDSAIGHPTVILKTDLLRKHGLQYDASFVPAEDYLFWVNLSQYCKLANLPEVLLQYRVHQHQISRDRRDEQNEKAQLVRNYQIEKLLNRHLTNEESIYNSLLFQRKININDDLFPVIREWINKLITINLLNKIYPRQKFTNLLNQQLNNSYQSYYLSKKNIGKFYSLRILKDFWVSKNCHFSYFSNMQKIVFSIKCLIKYPNHQL